MSEFPPDILKHVRLHERLEMVNNCCGDEHEWYTSTAGFAEQELTLSCRVHLSSVWWVLKTCTETPPGIKGGS